VKNNKGFTVIELLIVMFIMGGFVGGGFLVYALYHFLMKHC